MKRTLLLVLIMLVLTSTMSGCAGNSAAPSEITQSDTSQTSADINTGMSTSAETSAETVSETTATDFDSIPLKTITSANEIKYEFYNPKGGGLDELTGFSHNKVLFTRAADEQPRLSEESASDIDPQIFSYDIAIGKADYIADCDFVRYSMPNSIYINDRYFIHTTGSRKEGNDTAIYITDTKEKTTSVLDEFPGNFPSFSQYSDNELVYFYYYENNGTYYQYVKLYNFDTKKISVILENRSVTEDEPEIYAVDVCNGEIYSLYHKFINNKTGADPVLDTYINVYDINGNIVKSIQDIDLGIQYKEKTYDYYLSVWAIYVYDDNIFIKVRGMHGGTLFGFQYENGKLTQFYGYNPGKKDLYKKETFMRNETPVYAAKKDNFVYFRASKPLTIGLPTELMLLDLTTKKATRFKFNIDGYYILQDVVVNENNDVIFQLCDGEPEPDATTNSLKLPNAKYFYLSFEQIKNM